VAACRDARNVPTLPGIAPKEAEAAWAHVKELLLSSIDEKRTADESIHVGRLFGGGLISLQRTFQEDELCHCSNGVAWR